MCGPSFSTTNPLLFLRNSLSIHPSQDIWDWRLFRGACWKLSPRPIEACWPPGMIWVTARKVKGQTRPALCKRMPRGEHSPLVGACVAFFGIPSYEGNTWVSGIPAIQAGPYHTGRGWNRKFMSFKIAAMKTEAVFSWILGTSRMCGIVRLNGSGFWAQKHWLGKSNYNHNSTALSRLHMVRTIVRKSLLHLRLFLCLHQGSCEDWDDSINAGCIFIHSPWSFDSRKSEPVLAL